MKRPFLILITLLLVTTLIVAGTGCYLKYVLLKPLQLYSQDSVLSVPFMLMADDVAQYMLRTSLKPDQSPATEPPTEPEPPAKYTEPVEMTMPPTIPAAPEPTEPIVITESWFDDALFIGDSRTLGMRCTKRLGDADYFCAGSMSTFTALVWEVSDDHFYNKKLEQVLSNSVYNKVFIHLGLNECGYDHELVISAYQDVIDLVRKYQPDAAIILQSVMTVSREKATQEDFTLERINNLNHMIYELAEKNGLYHQDTNEFAADEEGYLRADISNDGCHPHNFGYEEWIEFIMDRSAQLGIQ